MNMKAAMRAPHAASKHFILHRRLLPVLVAGCFGTALANPFGPQVVNGQASFVNQGNVLSVTNTPGAIINWQSFSINPGELTRFIQQNPNSAVLNRIFGQDPSQILGALQSNGRVFLVNPNGILFGQGAQVDVNGLVASTLNISNEDFLNGKMLFKAGDKAGNLKNEGVIGTPAGGQVFLIAPNVENSGIITSPKGEVMLAAGHTVQLVDTLNPDLRVVLSAPENEALNLGQVIAQGGRTGIYGALVKQRGVVNADSAVVGENGKVILKASRDTLLEAGSRTTATGAGKGGEIQVLGERVALTGDAKVDASGQLGGGTVLVGGDYQGRNDAVQNAKRTYFGKDATLKADAVLGGNGGKVIVWADEDTRAYGGVSARGGATAGDGGFVEISGKRTLDFLAKVDTSAVQGKFGTLLLDPTDINIVSGVAFGGAASSLAVSDANSAGTGDFIWQDIEDTGTRNIGTTDIATLLTSNNLDLQASNNINWASGADLTYGGPARTLTLKAGNNISLQSAITSSNALNVTFLATTGDISLNGASIDANGGQVKLLGGSSVSFTNSAVESAAGTVSIVGGWDGNSASPAATGLSGVSLTDSHVSASTVILKAGTAGITTSGTGSHAPGNTFLSGYVALDSIGSINVSSLDGDVVARTTGAGSSITLQDPGALIVGSSAVGTIPAGISTNNGNITLTASAGMLGVNGAVSAGSGSITMNANTAGYGVTVGAAVSGGSATINGNSNGITISNPINMTGVLSLVSPGGTISQTAAVSAPGGIKAVGGTVTLKEANTTGIIAGSSSAGDFEFETNQTLSVQTVDGTAGINAGVDEVKLKSTHTGGINQDTTGAIVAGAGLGLISSGPVMLNHTGNSFTKLVANLTGGTGSLSAFTSVALDVGGPITVDGTAVTGITTSNKNVKLGSSVGLTVSDPINAGTGEVGFMSDSLTLGNTVTADLAMIRPQTAGKTITLGSATCDVPSCLAITNLYHIAAPTIGIGSDDAPVPGSIHVAGIAGAGTGVDNRNAVTTRIGLITGGGVTQSGVINVQDLGIKAGNSSNTVALGLANSVTNLAVETSGAPVSFNNATTLTLADIEGGDPLNDTDYGVYGISTNGGAVSLATVTGDINVGSDGILSGNGAVTLTATAGNIKIDPLTVAEIDSGTGNVTMTAQGNITIGGMIASGPTGNVSLTSTGGNIAIDDDIDAGTSGTVTLSAGGAITNASGTIYGSALSASATGGINLLTEVGTLSASNSGANSDITISNFKAATLHSVHQTTPGSTGNINITNYGTLTVSSDFSVQAEKGDINLTAYHALNVEGGVSTTGALAGECDIVLFAYPTDTAAGTDTLTITGAVTAVAGNITLKAGDSIVGEALATTSGTKTLIPNMNVVPVTTPPPPTLDQCTTDPTLSGCSAVLPTLETCTAAPATTGCSVVLPTVDACVSDPTKPGCTAVLPTLSTCTAAPATTGCSVVLPTVDACTANPSQTGCSAVLPSLDACTIAPATPGCSVVLPTLATCTTAPTTPGCSAVLPSVAVCTTAPTTVGCTVVLPPLSTCIAAPATAGCTAVLPTIDACTANPAQSGCSVVLPTLVSCTTNPAQAGCTVVLPTLNSCIAAPALAGCSAVLPTVAACTVNPTQTGCSVVLPTLSSCTSNPNQAGCAVVLPTLAQCSVSPALAGCSVVLPTLAQCAATPTLEGCSVVVPTVSKCVINPAAPECQTVLPVPETGPTQTPSNTITQTVTSTINLVVTSTVQASSNQVQSGGGGSSGGTISKPVEQTSEKSDEKKDDKKTTSSKDDSGAKKNEPAKKMYCN